MHSWLHNVAERVDTKLAELLMRSLRDRFPLLIIIVYLVAVVLCIFLAFDYAGAINLNWTLVLIALTLPWSLVSIVFVWALIHGAGLEFFTVMYLIFAGVNSSIFYWLYSVFRKRRASDMVASSKT